MRKRVEDMTNRELELVQARLESELSEETNERMKARLEACLDDVMTEIVMRRAAG